MWEPTPISFVDKGFTPVGIPPVHGALTHSLQYLGRPQLLSKCVFYVLHWILYFLPEGRGESVLNMRRGEE